MNLQKHYFINASKTHAYFLHCFASFAVEPSAKALKLTSEPWDEPSLHNPTKARTRTASELLFLYNSFNKVVPFSTINVALLCLDVDVIIASIAEI